MTTRVFGGTTHKKTDQPRFSAQLDKVLDLMSDGAFRTLSGISSQLSIPETSASARLRDLRKPQFGAFQVTRVRQDNLYLYQVTA